MPPPAVGWEKLLVQSCEEFQNLASGAGFALLDSFKRAINFSFHQMVQPKSNVVLPPGIEPGFKV